MHDLFLVKLSTKLLLIIKEHLSGAKYPRWKEGILLLNLAAFAMELLYKHETNSTEYNINNLSWILISILYKKNMYLAYKDDHITVTLKLKRIILKESLSQWRWNYENSGSTSNNVVLRGTTLKLWAIYVLNIRQGAPVIWYNLRDRQFSVLFYEWIVSALAGHKTAEHGFRSLFKWINEKNPWPKKYYFNNNVRAPIINKLLCINYSGQQHENSKLKRTF